MGILFAMKFVSNTTLYNKSNYLPVFDNLTEHNLHFYVDSRSPDLSKTLESVKSNGADKYPSSIL